MQEKEEPGVDVGRVEVRGLEIDIRAAHGQRPHFEPVLKRVSEAVREITGTNCAEQVAAKLRW